MCLGKVLRQMNKRRQNNLMPNVCIICILYTLVKSPRNLEYYPFTWNLSSPNYVWKQSEWPSGLRRQTQGFIPSWAMRDFWSPDGGVSSNSTPDISFICRCFSSFGKMRKETINTSNFPLITRKQLMLWQNVNMLCRCLGIATTVKHVDPALQINGW